MDIKEITQHLQQGIKRTPYKHQLEALELFMGIKECLYLWDMGTGKTGGAILNARMRYLQAGNMLRTLIVTPPVTIINWAEEFALFSRIPTHRIHPLRMNGSKKKAECVYNDVIPQHDGAVVITNYESLLSEDLFKALESWCPEIIIFDEMHYLKNAKTKRSRLCQRLANIARYKIGLTGTPILNNVMDIYGIFKTLDGGKTFGVNEYVFQMKYLIDMNATWKGRSNYFPKWVNNPKTYGDLNEKIYKVAVRKLKSECLDLPELVKITRKVPMSIEQKKAYDEMTRDFLTFVDTREGKESVTANLAVTKAMKLLQIASGFVQTDEKNPIQFKSIPKLEVLGEIVAEIYPAHKIIIWCSFIHNYRMIARKLDEMEIKYVMLTGEQSTNEKQESVDAFNKDDSVKIIIANRAAGGTGVNLTAAPYSIVYSRNFSLAEELQSEARNHRGGSEIHESIIKIDLATEGTIEEAVLEALQHKHQVSTDVIDMVRNQGV
jgi:SNF2 family DNA or RNA helicase